MISTHLKNMQPSNWIISPIFRVKITYIYLSCHHLDDIPGPKKSTADSKVANLFYHTFFWYLISSHVSVPFELQKTPLTIRYSLFHRDPETMVYVIPHNWVVFAHVVGTAPWNMHVFAYGWFSVRVVVLTFPSRQFCLA